MSFLKRKLERAVFEVHFYSGLNSLLNYYLAIKE